jgi:hypothetical protein
MRRSALLLILIAGLAGSPLPAQTILSSPAAHAIAVTVYRDPSRGNDASIALDDPPKGYALITETRIVDLPPGRVTLRFEGVASAIQPETAILSGADPHEKNQDRLRLSERGLIDAFTGQRVIVRRTDQATGAVTEESARIRSSHDGVILETSRGFESLRCTGLTQTLLYPRVPAGLSAKPVLSMDLDAGQGGRRELTLSYLASGFDWQANYVATLSPDTKRIDLFAWLTLASRDDMTFPAAQAAAVAGRVQRAGRADADSEEDDEEDWYSTACWPSQTTGTPAAAPEILYRQPSIAIRADDGYYDYGSDGADMIIVTGSRIARQEDLGDLKLYRVPFPVSIASNSQKQVALLSAPGVRGDLIYRTRMRGESSDDVEWLIRMRNVKQEGLGLALPKGQVAVFQPGFGRPMLLGEASIEDKAVGEDVEFVLDDAQAVSAFNESLREDEDSESRRLTVTNDNAFPVRYEAEFEDRGDRRFDRFSRRTFRRNGKTVWSVEIPAEGEVKLDYRETEIELADEDDADPGEDG